MTNNRDRDKEKRRLYKIQHREEINKKNREWRKRRKEHIKQYTKEYTEKNKERIKVRSHRYWEKNKEYFHKLYKAKRDQYKLLHPKPKKQYKGKGLKLRFKILQRDNFACQYCGRRPPETVLEIDHFFPRSKGGLNEIKNYLTSCRECNRGKGDAILNEYKNFKAPTV